LNRIDSKLFAVIVGLRQGSIFLKDCINWIGSHSLAGKCFTAGNCGVTTEYLQYGGIWSVSSCVKSSRYMKVTVTLQKKRRIAPLGKAKSA